MGAHAFLAPSAAHIWGPPNGCRAYPTMAAMYPEPDTDSTREGTAAHAVAEMLIAAGLRAVKSDVGIGYRHQNGVVINRELFEAAEVYAEAVLSECRTRGIFGGQNIGIETWVAMAEIHQNNSGTPDAWIRDQKARRLIVFDAKFGHGIVEADQNWQMIDYVFGIAARLGILGTDDDRITVEIVVVQPRAFHPDGPVRRWVSTLADLRPYWNDLAHSAWECHQPDPVARTGNHCRYCPARAHCGAFIGAALDIVDRSQSMAVQNMPADAIALTRRAVKRARDILDHTITGLDELAESTIQHGGSVPGLSLQQAYGRRTWAVDDDTIYAVGLGFGADLKKTQPLPVGEATKAVKAACGESGAEFNEGVFKQLTYKPARGHKLVETDSTLAALAFKPKRT